MGIIKDVQKIGNPVRRENGFERRLAKTTEEVGELAEAILSVTSVANSKNKEHMDIVEEAVDVAIMGLDIALTKPEDSWQTDAQWRDVVSCMFAKKLAKWRDQIETNTTLMPRKPVHKDIAAEIRRRQLTERTEAAVMKGDGEIKAAWEAERIDALIDDGVPRDEIPTTFVGTESIPEEGSDRFIRMQRHGINGYWRRGGPKRDNVHPEHAMMVDGIIGTWKRYVVYIASNVPTTFVASKKLTADEQFDAEIDAGLHK